MLNWIEGDVNAACACETRVWADTGVFWDVSIALLESQETVTAAVHMSALVQCTVCTLHITSIQ